MNLLRRHVLIALSLLPAGVATAGRPNAALGRLLAVCDDSAAAARLGACWQPPAGTTSGNVLARVLSRLGIDEHGLIELGDDPLREAIGCSVRADFAAGDTLTLKGWKLARTEVELCWLHHRAAASV